MDPRAYVLPVLSLVIVLLLASNPEITGFMVAEPEESRISANITVSINQDGFVTEESVVTVYLDDQKAEMPFREFVKKTGQDYNRVKSEVPSIGYDGYGYTGVYTYSLGISEFGIDTVVGPGKHRIRTQVSHGEHVFSDTTQEIPT